MQTNVKLLSNPIEVHNNPVVLTLKINKKELFEFIRNISAVVLFLILGILLVTTYSTDNPLFWPLLKAGIILMILAIIITKSKNITKK